MWINEGVSKWVDVGEWVDVIDWFNEWVGELSEWMVGRETGTTYIFYFGLICKVEKYFLKVS